jgi:hypothetical protein
MNNLIIFNGVSEAHILYDSAFKAYYSLYYASKLFNSKTPNLVLTISLLSYIWLLLNILLLGQLNMDRFKY